MHLRMCIKARPSDCLWQQHGPSVLGRTNLHTLPQRIPDPQNGPETSVELSGKRELCSFRRKATIAAAVAVAVVAWRCPARTKMEQLLAQAISMPPIASCQLPEIAGAQRLENGLGDGNGQVQCVPSG